MWAESITFRDQSQFSRREVVVFAVTVHLNFLNRLQRFFLKVVDWHLHYHGPDGLAVVENFRVLFLSLCAVKETSKQADDDFFE
jgi:hypothetical protein